MTMKGCGLKSGQGYGKRFEIVQIAIKAKGAIGRNINVGLSFLIELCIHTHGTYNCRL
jgi:hypothetical protein